MSITPIPDQTLGPAIETAEIDWQDGQPVSRAFGDVYFSRENGLEETRYVFLGHNRIEQRFAALEEGASFVVAETGFGTGLNFLATWRAWEHHAPPDARLHFVSVERYPLTPADLEQALTLWPELAPLAEALIAQYPALVTGTHRLVFDSGRVRLTLYFGEARDAWSNLRFSADAWYLDGFAPALNPDLWLEQLIGQIATRSRPGATVATFTAVGAVRRALLAAGFSMRKVPGFGRKREMLAGEFNAPASVVPRQNHSPVTIVGAGIAAALTARNLAERGRDVHIFSAGDEPADGASGNAQAALYVKLGVDYGPETQLALHALLHAQRTYQRYDPDNTRFWHRTGLLQLAGSEREADRQRRFLERNRYPGNVLQSVNVTDAQRLSGSPVQSGGLWFPDSGWLEPPHLCQWLLEHPRIQCHYGHKVEQVRHDGRQWQLAFTNSEAQSSNIVILTGGHQVANLLPDGQNYRFRAIRGQVSQLPAEAITGTDAVICGDSYLNPIHGEYAVTGATFDLDTTNPELLTSSHQENIDRLSTWLPGIWSQVPPPAAEALPGRVSFRCTTHDYQPVAGAAGATDEPRGLYVLTGLGSKGFALAPLLAEWLADVICGEPESLEPVISDRLSLARCRRSTDDR
ncbi:bifunctional tRNA (5-methylaminomethyl-2-thiouridine)(34)-methyltransferase MnmD/FAD-dependent 5-carboxymethylaminomethyl-2-thiouridine(34) oxidoreductase MnmC [Marinobacter nanhaiticus D15-8W]|uniref:tRNA 5-methylaminomethyl-2-thiouridine biosynthesis bifunctional protein MnmC n=1 Tax=Marinobacter nanhaiticus D15-8W TaxID=626887 RepID=N6VUN4_9GAMM|nr:bifunctional tRNA (5-methylaminomethyl-2-thiouridine)(34)-methyltransferase MnmD/FAD-dependent 5-carboxymethylaminomethyl-2-thiouridine(34) oxidoreductase MnmC [Marinobacter nanhaiticus]ENO13865.1 bifunctional tRNA (5-methylaminomethyl-2-thiouridine)(34)-methyltransferase MnmD/FAD-dependent 5-carboxymethylaminomethyl-2-thiouridine(34) oxidoreductase MnmC [Marinobacter nanhaiticus D15-8W]BES71242.1 bifunctional tRNA (5-methylaminomethyl-2-thiouridine)(34)-methyltransferase MnmD/FAD-dependent 5-